MPGPSRRPRRRLTASGLASTRSGGREFYVVSVQRNPESEEPEAPSPENRVEHRDRVVPVVIERPEIALREAPVTRRTIPWTVPTTGRRRTAPATRGRRSVPPRRRRSGRGPAIPAPSVLSGRRRCTVVGGAEAVRHIPGSAHLGTTPVERTSGRVRRLRSARMARPARSTRSAGSARSARSTRPARSAGSTRSMPWSARPRTARSTRTARPRPTRSRTAGSTGSAGSRTAGPARSTGPRRVSERPMPRRSGLQRGRVGGLDAHRQCRNADTCGNCRACDALHIHTC
jgi:hypothetical protein